MSEFNDFGYAISFTLNIPNINDLKNQILQNKIEQD